VCSDFIKDVYVVLSELYFFSSFLDDIFFVFLFFHPFIFLFKSSVSKSKFWKIRLLQWALTKTRPVETSQTSIFRVDIDTFDCGLYIDTSIILLSIWNIPTCRAPGLSSSNRIQGSIIYFIVFIPFLHISYFVYSKEEVLTMFFLFKLVYASLNLRQFYVQLFR
jgi:hypothetical protein